ncbi:hypothetical protein FBUS_04726 [Fasciolopsis buskii]|uniref:Uncharacterized protein n=1 Tax=Fasciolopsis buskii TaxID=27845 RepID=A0A8E0RW04_9TREM|nr:hypothetical protein FBUS_04726 [Fasciolopsis buski]
MEEPIQTSADSNEVNEVDNISHVPASQECAAEPVLGPETSLSDQQETSEVLEEEELVREQPAAETTSAVAGNANQQITETDRVSLGLEEANLVIQDTEECEDKSGNLQPPEWQSEHMENDDQSEDTLATIAEQERLEQASNIDTAEPNKETTEFTSNRSATSGVLVSTPEAEMNEIEGHEAAHDSTTHEIGEQRESEVTTEPFKTTREMEEESPEIMMTGEAKQFTGSDIDLMHGAGEEPEEKMLPVENVVEKDSCTADNFVVANEVSNLSEDEEERKEQLDVMSDSIGNLTPEPSTNAHGDLEERENGSPLPETESTQGHQLQQQDEADNISASTESTSQVAGLAQICESSDTHRDFRGDKTNEQEQLERQMDTEPVTDSQVPPQLEEDLMKHEEQAEQDAATPAESAMIAPASFVPQILDLETEEQSYTENSEADRKQPGNGDDYVYAHQEQNVGNYMLETEKPEFSEENIATEIGDESKIVDQVEVEDKVSEFEVVSENAEEQKVEIAPTASSLVGTASDETVVEKVEEMHQTKEETEVEQLTINNRDEVETSLPDKSLADSDNAHPSTDELLISYATQESISTQFETAEELNKTPHEHEFINPEHVIVEDTHTEWLHSRQQQQRQHSEQNEPIYSNETRDRPVCFTQELNLEVDRPDIEPLEDVLVAQAQPTEYSIGASCVADVCKHLETVTENEEGEEEEELVVAVKKGEQFTPADQSLQVESEPLSKEVVGESGQVEINTNTTMEITNSHPVLYPTEERDFSILTNEELGDENEPMIMPTTTAQIHGPLMLMNGSSKPKASALKPISANQAELLIRRAEQEREKSNLVNGYGPDSEEMLSDKENQEKYARLMGKLLPREQYVFDEQQQQQRKQRSKTLEPDFDVKQLKDWNESQSDVKRKSATLGRSGSRKRPRLLPKPSVNDDHLFPDSVTPSKVDRNLSVRSLSVGLPEGTYDVPYIDDDAFVPRRLRTQIDQNETNGNGSEASTESDEYMWDPSLSRFSALDPSHRADIDECIPTPREFPQTQW